MENKIMSRMMAFANNLPEGDESQNSKDSIDCPICGGAGYVIKDEDGFEVAVPCQCLSKRILQSRIQFLNLPQALSDMRLKSFSLGVYSPKTKPVAAAACQVVKYYLDNFDKMRESGKGLYLYSHQKGSGKTRMAASIANDLIHNHDISVRFMTSIAILDEIKNSWSSKEYTEHQVLDALFTVPVLVVDDFGAEKSTDWTNGRFYQIINERYLNNQVTIFTSNMSLDNLQCDSRIASRIKERCFQVDFPEESVRERISSKNHKQLMETIYERKA